MATKLTELSAINIILSNVGMAPVASVESNNPMVSLAKGMLDEVSSSIQSEGWSFNTEMDYPFSPSGGFIVIPNNVLSFDIQQYDDKDVVLRGGKLYDKREHAFVNEAVKLNVTWLFDFVDLPEAFKQYITIRAANLFAGRAVGSVEAVKYSEREEGTARAACMEYETQQGDYNYLGTTDNKKINTFMPYNVINR
tara:strand:- start:12132 stop:12716 length:585 start_codon:yes stop_codon:yes gene_type:complete